MTKLVPALLVITLSSVIVYGPALHRVFVTDQIWYLAELHGQTSLAAGLHFYDYAASRQYWKGDDALFRPLSLIWLAIGNSLFAYHHVWWNVANLVIHILVSFSLYALLTTITPSAFALAATMLFAVMKPPLELVMWNHLGGYLLACLFFAIALRSFVQIVRSGVNGSPYLHTAILVTALTAAALCHEAMVAVSFIAALLVLYSESRRQKNVDLKRALILLVPVLIFSFLYAFHLRRVERATYVDRPDVAGMFDARNVFAVAPRSVSIVGHWAAELMFPSAIAFTGAPFTRLSKTLAFSPTSLKHLLDAFLFLATAGLLASCVSRKHLLRMLPFIVLLFAGCFAYIAIICLGRGQADVLNTTYYLYFFCFIVIAFVYAIVDFERVRGWVVPVAWAVVLLWILVQATETREVAQRVGFINERASDYLISIDRFVATHKNEAGFTFAIQDAPPDLDPEVQLVEGYPDRPRAAHSLRLSEILFARYYDSLNPRYVLRGGELIVSRP
jgi:hypothetical protein